MFEKPNGIFSKDYNEYLIRKDLIRGLALDAIEKMSGITLYGQPVNKGNPEEVIAALYLMYKDASIYRETV
jgi:hypothetical protein